MKSGSILALCSVAVLALAWLASAETPEETFKSLFGKDYDQALKMPDKKDALALAERLVKIMGEPAIEPPMKALICQKICSLVGDDQAGYPTAVAALVLLGKSVPEKKAESLEKAVEIHVRRLKTATGIDKEKVGQALVQAQVDLGDLKAEGKDYDAAAALYVRAVGSAQQAGIKDIAFIKPKQDTVHFLKTVALHITELETRLKDNPTDPILRKQLVQAHLVELDDPAGAAAALAADDQSDLAKNIRVAAKGVAGVPPTAAMDMATWYRELAAKALVRVQVAMLKRARTYCERFIALHPVEDIARIKAKSDLEEMTKGIEAAEKKFAPPPSGKDPVVGLDLLAAFTPTDGAWAKDASGLRNLEADSHIKAMLPVLVKGDYELLLEIGKVTGTGQCMVGLPVGTAAVTLLLDGGSGSSGLNYVATKDHASNPTVSRGNLFQDGKKHLILAQVKMRGDLAQIIVYVDDKQLFQWEGAQKTLTPDQNLLPPDKAMIGLNTWKSTYNFSKIQLRMLSGRADRP